MILIRERVFMTKGPDLHTARKLLGLRVFVAAAIGLCPLAASAQELKLGEDPISVMMKWRPTTQPREMPEFVKRTRPPEDQLNYTPLTGADPKRPPRKTPAELAATMHRLDSAAAGARARGAAIPDLKPIVRKKAPREPDPVPAQD
jgi:hypothetical protein